MAIKTLKLEITFQDLLAMVQQLDSDEKLLLKNTLERENVMTWQELFGQSLKTLDVKNSEFAEKDVKNDVSTAIFEVRAVAKN
ncbi:MAG: hypothetical protein HQK88_14990 [Nitrospirae bacterium]|nr:hypothetical protein [Nitrospirota bacterium]MBF0618106.1 hypothetical protein [Nitrospirota bacterium]